MQQCHWTLSAVCLEGFAHLLEINEFARRAGPGGNFPFTEDGCNCSFVLLLCFVSLSYLHFCKVHLPNQYRGISVSFWVLAKNRSSLIVPALNRWHTEVVLFCCMRCYKWGTKWFSVLHRDSSLLMLQLPLDLLGKAEGQRCDCLLCSIPVSLKHSQQIAAALWTACS